MAFQEVLCPFEVMWSDADPAGWVHWAAVTRYFESGETAFFRAAGLTYMDFLDRGWGAPRVHLECDYRRPLRAHDVGTVRTTIAKLGTTSITLSFQLVKEGDSSPSVEGSLTMVLIDFARVEPQPLPEELRNALDRLSVAEPGRATGP